MMNSNDILLLKLSICFYRGLCDLNVLLLFIRTGIHAHNMLADVRFNAPVACRDVEQIMCNVTGNVTD